MFTVIDLTLLYLIMSLLLLSRDDDKYFTLWSRYQQAASQQLRRDGSGYKYRNQIQSLKQNSYRIHRLLVSEPDPDPACWEMELGLAHYILTCIPNDL